MTKSIKVNVGVVGKEIVNNGIVGEEIVKNEVVNLNKEQLEAVNTISGNLLILASAGTGKTTTIVERYVNLVENHNIKPNEVMMTTFTNKAAKDMIKKISKRTDKIPKSIGTMHSLFLRILRDNAEKVGFNVNFTILTEDNDKKKIIKNILVKKGVDVSKDNILYLLKRIEKFKNIGVLAESLGESLDLDDGEIEEEIESGEFITVSSNVKKILNSVYKQYQDTLKNMNTLDFDDILLLTLKLFQDNDNLRDSFKEKLKVIMVDEAQDLNVVQMKILELLQNNNLCLIGDDCQNIYSWRGSSNELIFNFDRSCKRITLTDNYRSSKKIIDNVNNIINSINIKLDKKLIHTRGEGEHIKIKEFYSFREELMFIAYDISTLLEKKEKAEEIAVLFRTNRIGKQIERAFRRNKIPCHLSRAKGFFEREEVKDLLSFLKLMINPNSVLEFERILNLIEGVGKSKINKLKDISESNKISIVDSLKYLNELNLNNSTNQKLSNLRVILNDKKSNPIRAFLRFFEYFNYLEKKYSQDIEKIEDKEENVNVLIDLFEEFKLNPDGIREFLDSLIGVEKKKNDSDKVTLTTIHSAKGLEWKHTYISGCNETILPSYVGGLTKTKIDDELRLFYVAVSRAKDFLTITHSVNCDYKKLEPSQFLDIIDGNFDNIDYSDVSFIQY